MIKDLDLKYLENVSKSFGKEKSWCLPTRGLQIISCLQHKMIK